MSSFSFLAISSLTILTVSISLISPVSASWANREKWLSAMCSTPIPDDTQELLGVVEFNNFRFFADDLITTIASETPSASRPAYWDKVQSHVVASEERAARESRGDFDKTDRGTDLSFLQEGMDVHEGMDIHLQETTNGKKGDILMHPDSYFGDDLDDNPLSSSSGLGSSSGKDILNPQSIVSPTNANAFGIPGIPEESVYSKNRAPPVHYGDDVMQRDTLNYIAKKAPNPKHDGYFTSDSNEPLHRRDSRDERHGGGVDDAHATSPETPEMDANVENRLDAIELNEDGLSSYFRRSQHHSVKPARADGDDVSRRPGYDRVMHGSGLESKLMVKDSEEKDGAYGEEVLLKEGGKWANAKKGEEVLGSGGGKNGGNGRKGKEEESYSNALDYTDDVDGLGKGSSKKSSSEKRSSDESSTESSSFVSGGRKNKFHQESGASLTGKHDARSKKAMGEDLLGKKHVTVPYFNCAILRQLLFMSPSSAMLSMGSALRHSCYLDNVELALGSLQELKQQDTLLSSLRQMPKLYSGNMLDRELEGLTGDARRERIRKDRDGRVAGGGVGESGREKREREKREGREGLGVSSFLQVEEEDKHREGGEGKHKQHQKHHKQQSKAHQHSKNRKQKSKDFPLVELSQSDFPEEQDNNWEENEGTDGPLSPNEGEIEDGSSSIQGYDPNIAEPGAAEPEDTEEGAGDTSSSGGSDTTTPPVSPVSATSTETSNSNSNESPSEGPGPGPNGNNGDNVPVLGNRDKNNGVESVEPEGEPGASEKSLNGNAGNADADGIAEEPGTADEKPPPVKSGLDDNAEAAPSHTGDTDASTDSSAADSSGESSSDSSGGTTPSPLASEDALENAAISGYGAAAASSSSSSSSSSAASTSAASFIQIQSHSDDNGNGVDNPLLDLAQVPPNDDSLDEDGGTHNQDDNHTLFDAADSGDEEAGTGETTAGGNADFDYATIGGGGSVTMNDPDSNDSKLVSEPAAFSTTNGSNEEGNTDEDSGVDQSQMEGFSFTELGDASNGYPSRSSARSSRSYRRPRVSKWDALQRLLHGRKSIREKLYAASDGRQWFDTETGKRYPDAVADLEDVVKLRERNWEVQIPCEYVGNHRRFMAGKSRKRGMLDMELEGEGWGGKSFVLYWDGEEDPDAARWKRYGGHDPASTGGSSSSFMEQGQGEHTGEHAETHAEQQTHTHGGDPAFHPRLSKAQRSKLLMITNVLDAAQKTNPDTVAYVVIVGGRYLPIDIWPARRFPNLVVLYMRPHFQIPRVARPLSPRTNRPAFADNDVSMEKLNKHLWDMTMHLYRGEEGRYWRQFFTPKQKVMMEGRGGRSGRR